ncbi:DUF6807 domain-containing protein [Salinactinospora qingdaonensis]|uniref:PmoA family protein n=1 Tax=Salinactinospora qingdaonensis TaxID=702744 RepID=A0ABP7FLA5_9ACTN
MSTDHGDPPVKLRAGERPVATWRSGAGVEDGLSPRPYLETVRTLGGTVVTEVRPEDHPHHLGVSMAVADVCGTNFWGGTTFVRGQGPTWLANHGRQRHREWLLDRPEHRRELVSWQRRDGAEVFTEERDYRAVALTEFAWALEFTTRLHNTSGGELSIGSPATNGRPDAGYGGFFWRAPIAAQPPRCFGPEGAEGEEALHGSRARWLALSGTTPGAAWTLLFTAADEAGDPWFVRAQEYPGVGASLAWDRELAMAADARLYRSMVTVVVDGAIPATEAEKLVELARQRLTETR